MKKFILLFSILLAINVKADDYIVLNDGTCLWEKFMSQNDSTVSFESTRARTFRRYEIKLIEFERGGVSVYTQSAIIPAPKRQQDYFGRDCRVYVPFSSSKANQREGCIALRNLLKKQNYWKIADCEQEANLIVELYVDEEGEDRAYVRVTDNTNADYYVSERVKAWANWSQIIMANPWDLNEQIFKQVRPKGIGEKIAWCLMPSLMAFQDEHNPEIPSVDVYSITNPLAIGNSVYLSPGAEQEDVMGTAFLISKLKEDRFWKIARCPKEAHFIMQFRFSDEGSDHANIFIYDRKGFMLDKSSKVGADEGPEIKEAAEKLYKNFVLKIQKQQKKKVR